MTPHVVLNATAYDGLPSGARSRAVCLAAAWLDLGVRVTLFAPRGVSLLDEIASERRVPGPGPREIPTPFHSGAPLRRALRSATWLRGRMPSDADLFVTDFYPVLDDVPTALTVHDLRYLAVPEHESALRARWFLRRYPDVARRAPFVIVPTRAVADEAERRLGVLPERLVVARNALRREWRTEGEHPTAGPPPADGPALAIGVGDRRKNLDVLLRALRRLERDGRAARPLMLVGRRCRRIEALFARAPDLEASGALRHAGVVTDCRLRELLRRASLVVHPSRYEGFGLTVIESLACGRPVVAGRCPAVEEVAAGHVRLLDPDDVDAWADALARGTGDARDADERDAARRHALGFRWSDAAEEILRATGNAPARPAGRSLSETDGQPVAQADE